MICLQCPDDLTVYRLLRLFSAVTYVPLAVSRVGWALPTLQLLQSVPISIGYLKNGYN